jgi:hypothetical protein
MNNKSVCCAAIMLSGLISSAAMAGGSKPSFIGKIKLGFQHQATCQLSDASNDEKSSKKKTQSSVEGRSNISHDESTISWTSSCVIPLPKSVKYCLLSSQQIENPDAFVSWYSGFQTSVLRAKTVSESDINPGFGQYTVTYLCFE